MAKGGTGIAGFTVQEITDDDRIWISKVLRDRWGEARIVSRGRVHDASQLPGFIAMNDGQPLGLLTYHLCENDCPHSSLTCNRWRSFTTIYFPGSLPPQTFPRAIL